MRNLIKYDLIISDIDDTLIYGFWTDLMHYTWKYFRSNLLSAILMTLQQKFKIYNVNMKLYYMLKNATSPIVFLTVRASNPATVNMLYDIMGDKPFGLIELGTDLGVQQKAEVVENYLERFPNILFIDDNDAIRNNVAGLEVDVLNPVLLREKKCQ